jgi:phage virion morphogenesis protein
MSGVAVEVTLDDADLRQALSRLAAADLDEIAFAAGQMVEDQTRRRIADEKIGPDGLPWAAWSPDYAATRSAKHSLLIGEGNPGLLESIQNYTEGETVRVGTPLVYGAIHQMGGAGTGKPGLPARPYLGLSEANRQEITELVTGLVEDILQ